MPCFKNLALAERHVLNGRTIVARQRVLVSARKEAGHDTFDAETLVDEFERTLVIFEEDYRAIRTELENQNE